MVPFRTSIRSTFPAIFTGKGKLGCSKTRSKVASKAKILTASPAFMDCNSDFKKLNTLRFATSKANKFRPLEISPSLYTNLNCFNTSESIF